jgi:hypothetical protein
MVIVNWHLGIRRKPSKPKPKEKKENKEIKRRRSRKAWFILIYIYLGGLGA